MAGTLVATSTGATPIEEIEVGDLVWARDVETGETALKPVTELIRRDQREIWEVDVMHADGSLERFETTDDHPWWIDGNGWVATEQLRPGLLVTTKALGRAEIARVERTERIDATYNLTVADFGTYFVGQHNILVHNCDVPKDVTTRPSSFRKQTVQDAWDDAAPGSRPGTKACPTCDRDLEVAPGSGRRDWDVDHQPKWRERDLEGMTRKEILDEFNRDVRARCPSCNRGDQ